MAEFEDLLDELREVDEGLAERFEKFKGSSLRKENAELAKKAARAEELEAENASLKAAPKKREAFEKYGIDFENLSKLERKALEAFDGEITDEAIAAFVEENELPVRESEESGEADEESDAEKIAGSARRAGANGGRTPKLTPEEVGKWPADKWVRFADANPDAAEALRRGEEVTGVTG